MLQYFKIFRHDLGWNLGRFVVELGVEFLRVPMHFLRITRDHYGLLGVTRDYWDEN